MNFNNSLDQECVFTSNIRVQQNNENFDDFIERIKQQFKMSSSNTDITNYNRTEEKNNMNDNCKAKKPPLKNIVKNIITPFRQFCGCLSQRNVDDILTIGETTDIKVGNLMSHEQNSKNSTNQIFVELDSIINSKSTRYETKSDTLWNTQLINRINCNLKLRTLLTYWLKYIADYWIFKFSKIQDSKDDYRKVLPTFYEAVKNKKTPRFVQKRYSKQIISQNPPLPECLSQDIFLNPVKQTVKTNENNTNNIVQPNNQSYNNLNQLINKDYEQPTIQNIIMSPNIQKDFFQDGLFFDQYLLSTSNFSLQKYSNDTLIGAWSQIRFRNQNIDFLF